MRLLLLGLLSLAVSLGPFVSGESAWAGESPVIAGNSVTITRDEWGVAHVHGKSHADAAFGMGYAQAEDHFWQLEDTCLRSLGRYAEVGGDSELSSDILNRSFEIVRRSQEDFPRLTPELQGMATAYAEGINRYLTTHPETKPRRLTHFEPWYALAMDRHMILYFVYGAAHVRRPSSRPVGEFAGSAMPIMPSGPALALASWDVPEPAVSPFSADVRAAIGSNAWAISGKKTASGRAMLFINPHQPWYGMGQFYECHMRSDEGLNFSGACFLGNPFPTIGHNEHLGWTYTVNDVDIADAWRVTFDDKAHPLNYRFDGGYRTAVEWSETLKVKQGDALVDRVITFRKTHHGPITHKENDTTYLAVQVARLFDINRGRQGWGMVLARNFAEWRAAMSYCALPMFNVVYADRQGNIFYAYNGAIPVRDPAFNWHRPVDGSDPRTGWKGFHTFDQLPQVFNPKSGYVQNCNSSPYTTTHDVADNPSREQFPPYMLEDHDVDMRRAKMSRRLLQPATGLTFAALQKLAYDTTLYWPLTEIPALKDDFARLRTTNPTLAAAVGPAFAHLQDWDCRSSLESTQTTLCLAWYEELYGFGYPAETLKPEYRADRLSWFVALDKATKKLARLYGSWKYPWGQAHRLQRIADQPDVEHAALLLNGAKASLPVAERPARWGSFIRCTPRPRSLFFGLSGMRWSVLATWRSLNSPTRSAPAVSCLLVPVAFATRRTFSTRQSSIRRGNSRPRGSRPKKWPRTRSRLLC